MGAALHTSVYSLSEFIRRRRIPYPGAQMVVEFTPVLQRATSSHTERTTIRFIPTKKRLHLLWRESYHQFLQIKPSLLEVGLRRSVWAVTDMEAKPSDLLTAAPPYGHVICSEKWTDSALVRALKGEGLKILFENELHVADFLLPNKRSILYISECDIIAASSYRRKLVRYRNASNSFQELVLVDRTGLSEQYFRALQRFIVLELGLPLLPVGGQAEASQLIAQMVQADGRDNIFRRSSCWLLDPLVLTLVQQIPGVGRVKALTLLQKFSSIQELCSAAPEDLEPMVGQALAQQIHSFFH